MTNIEKRIIEHMPDAPVAFGKARTTVASGSVPVTIDGFRRAESDHYFDVRAEMCGGLGKLHHNRTPTDVDHQSVIRVNRDTLYSYAVFDLTTPVTLTLPDAHGRFLSMVCINQDHYIKFSGYEPGDYTFTADQIGTRYLHVAFRTFVDPEDPSDVKIAHAIQDQIGVSQERPGLLELPRWDQESLDACRAAILQMAPFVPDSDKMFGDVDEVDDVRHLIGTAGGWGGNRQQDAIYLNVMPERNDGRTAHTLTVKNVPIDGFWSISVYNEKGYFEKNEYDSYSLNNVTAAPEADGSIVFNFGGDPSASNFLYIMPGWNYTVRLYRPRQEILDGSWQFPLATAVE